MTRIKAVIFDMDNTLHNLHAAAEAAADAVSLFCGAEFTLHFTPLNRDRPSLRAEFVQFFGCEETAEEAFSLYYQLELQCLREFDGMREVLISLKNAGMKLAVLSNSDGHSVYPRLEMMGLNDFFDAVFVRESFAEIKPSPAVFAAVLEYFGLAADEVIMVGDSLKNDVAAARACGISAIHAWYGSWENRDAECAAACPADILKSIFEKK